MLPVTMNPQQRRYGLYYLALSLFLLPSALSFALPPLFPHWGAAELNFVYFFINFLAATILFRSFLLESVKALGDDTFRLIRAVVFGFLGYWSLNYAVSSLILFFVPDFSNINDSSLSQTILRNYPLMAAGTVLLVPVAEECFHRGLVFGWLLEKSRLLAYLVSITLFAAIHVIGYMGLYEPRILMLCFVQYLPAGFCLAWAYREAGNILAPILIHAAVNAIGIFLLR